MQLQTDASIRETPSIRGLSHALLGAIAFAIPVTGALGQYFLPFNVGVQLYGFRLIVLGALPILLFISRWRIPLSGVARLFGITFYIWLVWGATSISWTPDPVAGVSEIQAVAFGAAAAVAIALACAMRSDGVDLLRRGWVAAYIATLSVAIWELKTGSHLQSAFAEGVGEDVGQIVVSTFGNPNNYAAFIVLAFPFLLWSLGRARGPSWICYLGLSLSAPVLLVLTSGRLGLVALALQMGLLVFLQRRRGASLMWLLPLGAVVTTIVVYMLQANPRVLSKLLLIGDELSAQGGSARLNLTINGLQFTAESFGIGKGAGSFEYLILAGRGNLPTWRISNPHDFWIEVLSQYGVIVFGCLVGCLSYACVLVFRLSRPIGRAGGEYYWPLVALGLGLSGYWLVAVENSRFIPQPMNWVFMGTVMALTSQLSVWSRSADMNRRRSPAVVVAGGD